MGMIGEAMGRSNWALTDDVDMAMMTNVDTTIKDVSVKIFFEFIILVLFISTMNYSMGTS